MVHLDRSIEMYTADLVSRLSLMCIESQAEPKIKHPLSDPTHLSHRCRQAVNRLVNKSHDIPTNRNRSGNVSSYTAELANNSPKSNSKFTIEVQEKVRVAELKTNLSTSNSLQLGGNESTHTNPSKLRLSYPITHSVESRLPHSYNISRSTKSRPLTPILKTHCPKVPTKPIAMKPTQIDFLAQLPVDITLLLLKCYINPDDILNLRLVNRHYHMLCQLKHVKSRWKKFITNRFVDAKQRGQENPIVRPSWINTSPMSKSMGVLSPIQTAASESRKWQVYNSPQSALVTSRRREQSPRQTKSLVISASRGVSPRTPSRLTRRTPSVLDSPTTPIHLAHRANSIRHPSKRVPSHKDLRYDSVATPDKDKVTGSSNRKELGFLTPSKRYADGINKITRTPLKTLNFGTPSSTCSSRTSVSSTSSLATPEIHSQSLKLQTPTSVDSGFKVPPLPTRSRQRLKRL